MRRLCLKLEIIHLALAEPSYYTHGGICIQRHKNITSKSNYQVSDQAYWTVPGPTVPRVPLSFRLHMPLVHHEQTCHLIFGALATTLAFSKLHFLIMP